MKKILFALIACAGLAFTSCELDEYNPTAVTGDDVLATYDGIYGTQAMCYAPIYGQLYTVFDFMSMAEGGTDMWWPANNSDSYKETMSYESLVPFANKGWDKAFTQMYSALDDCNLVIARANSVTESPESVKILKAEAQFLRAYYHLLLTTYYGPITLVMNEPSIPIVTPSRNSLSEIYAAIINDLNEAIAVLGETPFENNRQRPTKAAARGMMARAYIQGAGQGLTENGKSYYERAKEVAEAMIADYGTSKMYTDISDTWADANNRNNKEALFVAASVYAVEDSDTYWYGQPSNNKLWTYTFPKLQNFSELNGVSNDKQNYLYGRVNNNLLAPSKYMVEVFDPAWDKRWENTFTTAFASYSMVQAAWTSYLTYSKVWTDALVAKYDLDPAIVGKRIYPYADCKAFKMGQGANQYTASVWPKAFGPAQGNEDIAAGSDVSGYNLETPKKIFVVDYPLAADDNRFYLYLYPNSADNANFDKTGRQYACVNINDLFAENGTRYVANAEEMTALKDKTSMVYAAFPALNKFLWNYDGVFYGSNLQIRNGDIMIMRMAEIYLIAAEANVALGDGATAAQQLNVLRKRAARAGVAESKWKLTTADKDTVLDEYARELCGEFQRWAVLQRNGALKDRLTKYNKRAAAAFQEHHVWRPISQTFLQQIDNAEAYGDNGYGTTAKSGLDGYLQ